MCVGPEHHFVQTKASPTQQALAISETVQRRPATSKSPHFSFKNILKIVLRNRIVALIFATEWFRNKNLNKMRRDIFQAIADPTRRAIITLIALQAMTPNAIADNFHTTRQSVSKHLRILTECELVKQEQKGREIYYSLEIEKMKEIDKWIRPIQKNLGNPIQSTRQSISNH